MGLTARPTRDAVVRRPKPVPRAPVGMILLASYTAASSIIPTGARGTGFGLLTTASLVGLAVSPIVSGLLGATSIRAVFLVDAVLLGGLAIMVSRLMITSPVPVAAAPPTEEV